MEIEKKAKFTTQLIAPRKLDIPLFCTKNWGFRDDHTEGRMEMETVGEGEIMLSHRASRGLNQENAGVQ